MPDRPVCWHDPTCTKAPDRHEHDYRQPAGMNARCRCGSRRFKVKVGGLLPSAVSCRNCGARHRVASAYEEGREMGRLEVKARATAEAPF
jgi:hypothetical protein